MKILKWIGIGLLVVLVILIIAGLVGKTVIEGKIKKMAEKQGTEMLKVPVKIGAVALNPLLGRAAVKGVKIGNPAGFSKENAFELGSFSIGVSYPALLKKQYVITGVAIKKPVINVEILKNKKSNIMAIMNNIPKPETKKNAKPLPEFLVKKIDLAGGQVKVTDAGFASGTAKISLDDINFRSTDLTNLAKASAPKDAGRFKLTAKLNNKSPLTAEGSIEPFAKKINFDIQALLSNIILTDFAPYYAKAPVKINRGSASVKMKLPCRAAYLNGTCWVNTSGLDVSNKPGKGGGGIVGGMGDSMVDLLKDSQGRINFDFKITGPLARPNIGFMAALTELAGRAAGKAAVKTGEKIVKDAIVPAVRGLHIGF